jgi:hypothetical protein
MPIALAGDGDGRTTRMDEHAIIESAYREKQRFGVKCTKLAGAVTVEALRRALKTHGFATSERDVFIRGVPIEVDLLIPRPDAVAENGLVYEPEDVLVVFEVKHSGVYSRDGRKGILACFTRIQDASPAVRCAYVTLIERRGYKWALTQEQCGDGQRSFTLFWRGSSEEPSTFQASGDWETLLVFLRDAASRQMCGSPAGGAASDVQ